MQNTIDDSNDEFNLQKIDLENKSKKKNELDDGIFYMQHEQQRSICKGCISMWY